MSSRTGCGTYPKTALLRFFVFVLAHLAVARNDYDKVPCVRARLLEKIIMPGMQAVECAKNHGRAMDFCLIFLYYHIYL